MGRALEKNAVDRTSNGGEAKWKKSKGSLNRKGANAESFQKTSSVRELHANANLTLPKRYKHTIVGEDRGRDDQLIRLQNQRDGRCILRNTYKDHREKQH